MPVNTVVRPTPTDWEKSIANPPVRGRYKQIRISSLAPVGKETGMGVATVEARAVVTAEGMATVAVTAEGMATVMARAAAHNQPTQIPKPAGNLLTGCDRGTCPGLFAGETLS
jgi:hypothetical protein